MDKIKNLNQGTGEPVESNPNKPIIESENCIVAFLDILGYSKLIKEKPPAKISDAFRIVFDTLEQFKKNPGTDQDIKRILNHIRVTMLSDSLVFALDLAGLPKIDKKFDDASGEGICIIGFLHHISLFAITLMMKLHYFLRGGVVKGQYRQEEILQPTNQLIISSALTDAYELEKKQADVPRILMSDKLCAFMEGKGMTDAPPQLKRGEDGLYYLDLYGSLLDENFSSEALTAMASLIKRQMENNKGDLNILRKIYWFQQYHNSRVRELKVGNGEQYIVPDVPYLT